MTKSLKKIFKREVDGVVPYEPGKPIEDVERELGLSRVIKLASNENPLGPSPKAMRALRRAIGRIHLYPDGGCYYLKKRLARALGVRPTQLVIGNGSNEIIELLARGFLERGDRVVSSGTSFLVYPIIAQVCGGEFVSVPMLDFRYDLNAIAAKIDRRTKLVFISNPNNPTGTYVTRREVDVFMKRVPPNVIVCFDEAYYDFVDARDFPDSFSYVGPRHPNVIILRTFSKSYGLAGLRVGYGVADEEMVIFLNKVRQPFNVSRLAQVAACAALDDSAFLRRTQQLVSAGRQFLYAQFLKMELFHVPSQANFIMLNVRRDATKIFGALMREGVIVRSMKAYGLPTYIRVTVGKKSENVVFIRALGKVLGKF